MVKDESETIEALDASYSRLLEVVKSVGYKAMTDRLGQPNERDVINEVDAIVHALDSVYPHIEKIKELSFNNQPDIVYN